MPAGRQGLTLVELLIVITIIGLLAGVFGINVGKFRARARDSQRSADIRTLQQGLAFYYYRSEYSGAYPIEDTYITGTGTLSQELRANGAISTVPLDPINQENYRYYYCSLQTNCSALGGAGTGRADGTSYILMYYMETGAVPGTVKGQNQATP